MPLSKKQLSEKKEIQLCENVRLLRSGAWGYIYKKKAIFQSMNAEKCNEFSIWAESTKNGDFDNPNKVILETAFEWQQKEPKIQILPKCHLCDAPHWYASGENYGAVIRQQSLHTNK
jgi:hypothetical protein